MEIYLVFSTFRARGSVVGRGAMLQAGRSRVRFPMRPLDFFFDSFNPFSRTTDLMPTQPLTEMSTRNLLGVKGYRCVGPTTSPLSQMIFYKIWEPRRLTTIWAFTDCYRGIFTFLPLPCLHLIPERICVLPSN
jgi:hypothetical protein